MIQLKNISKEQYALEEDGFRGIWFEGDKYRDIYSYDGRYNRNRCGGRNTGEV